MANIIITGGTRRERSEKLTGLLGHGTGRHWLVAVPCGLPDPLPAGIRGVGHDDLHGALDAIGRIHGHDTLAVESVEYWCMGASEPIPNPGNEPRVAEWNRRAREAASARARFRHAMQTLGELEPDVTVILTASTADNARRLLGEYPMGVSYIACERRDLDNHRTIAPGLAA